MDPSQHCVFCNIVAGKEPANVIYEDDSIIVVQNLLRWVPIMFLAMKKAHTTQAELWSDVDEVGRVASRIGQEHCPRGFRLVSNFGYDGMQSQEHGHVHIVGGTHLGPYV